jgi:DNA replication and repair protein RecF
MILEELSLKNYRNHQKLDLNPDPELTIITGSNGTGKTNIIEATNLISTGKPFRARRQTEAIQHDKDAAFIQATLKDQQNPETKPAKIGISIGRSDKNPNLVVKKVKINGKPQSISSLGEKFTTVLFSPLDMDLLIRGPSTRRDFWDNVLSQTNPVYSKALRNYTKARRQRNKVLEGIRDSGGGYAQLKYWDEKVLFHGREIQKERTSFVNYVNDRINQDLRKIDPTLETRIKYEVNLILEEKLEKIQPKEIAAGTTLIGPHRDDFALIREERDLADFASRGQQRTLILALKMSELGYLREKGNASPMLLLDDVFSELDEQHKETVREMTKEQQTIITATEVPQGYAHHKTVTLDK